jgi:SAM-dependent methyltransferase
MNESIDSLYLDPERYDLIYGEYTEIPKWLFDDIPQNGNILELACGTGRCTIPIAQQGREVWGIDNSPPMLHLCSVKAEQAGVNISLFPDDIRDFDLNKQFSMIMLVSNTLWHLLSHDDAVECFSCVKKHIKPDGIFMISVFVPDPEILSRDPEKRYEYGDYIDPETGDHIFITHTAQYDRETQIRDIQCYKGDEDQVIAELRLRMYFPEELDTLLLDNGFSIKNKYGCWDKTPFGLKSKLQLIFSTKTPE